jgi:hypothetical protein
MKNHKLEIMKKVLKPVSKERVAEIVRSRTSSGGFEQLTLQDAGVEKEVRQYRARVYSRRTSLLVR